MAIERIKYIKTDKNGTKYYEAKETCWKCDGKGIIPFFMNVYNGECFACNGRGYHIITDKEYTPEHLAKLETARAKRQAKAQEEAQKAQKEYEEREAKRKAEEEKRKAEREAEWAKKREQSQHVGEVGKKVACVVTLEYVAHYTVKSFTGFGETEMTVYGMRTERGDMLIWKTASGCLCIEHEDEYGHIDTEVAEKGDKLTIRGTIKEHGEYKGEKQTILTRVKLMTNWTKEGK